MTQQGDRQASVRAVTGTALHYEGDWLALFDQQGIAAGEYDGRFLAWTNATLGTSYGNLPQAQQALAVQNGAFNYSSLGTFTIQPTVAVLNFLTGLYSVGTSVSTDPSTLPGWSFTRASTGTAQNAAGTVLSFATGVPRLTDLGLLIEGAATNILLQSNTLNGTWLTGTTGVSVVQNITGPDAAANVGWTVTQTGANASDSRLQQGLTVANDGATYVWSCFIPKATVAPSAYPAVVLGLTGGTPVSCGVVVDPVAGAIQFVAGATGRIDSAGAYWRVSVALANNTSGNTALAAMYYPGWAATYTTVKNTVAGAAYGWAFGMVETSPLAPTKPSSYIPTTVGAVTRATDVPQITGLPAPSTEMTLFAQAYLPTITDGASSYQSFAALDDNTLNNQIAVFKSTTNNKGRVSVTIATVSPVDVFCAGSMAAGINKLSIYRTAGNWIGEFNGTATVPTAAGVPATATQLNLGAINPNVLQLNGYLQRVVYFPSAVPGLTA